MTDEQRANLREVFDWIIRICLPVLIGVGSFFATKIMRNSDALIAIENSRYTAHDASEDTKRVSAICSWK